MTPSQTCDQQSLAFLLEKALRQPFAHDAVDDWFRALMRCCPLWSFQAWAFAELQDSKLPTNYPLQMIIERICEDEGLPVGKRTILEPLEAALDHRRYDLADSGRHGPPGKVLGESSLDPGTYESLPLPRRESSFNRLYPRPVDPWHDPSRDPSHLGPDAEIGKQLRQLTTARNDAAPGSSERAHAQEALDEFLESTGVAQSPGKPSRITDRQLAELVIQGRNLFETVWPALPAAVSQGALDVVASHGVKDGLERELWAMRLVLPVLSRPEISGLLDQIRQAATWSRAGPQPTARLFTIWALARRLRLEPTLIADRTLGSKAREYFVGKRNPIQAAP